jgi:hypothetical protein
MTTTHDDNALTPKPGESETEFAHRACEMMERVRERVSREVLLARAAAVADEIIAGAYRNANLPLPALELGGAL